MNSSAKRLPATTAHLPAMASVFALVLATTLALLTPPLFAKEVAMSKPTVVLVHGAFAESASWDRVTSKLLAKGYPVVAVANPLRGVKSDATYLSKVLESISGSVILVGHSYGGNVISNVPTTKTNVKALIYVAGVAPDIGESAATLSGKFPGSTLGPTLSPPVLLADGNKDLYIQQDKFPAQFAADVQLKQAKLMATAQRPITEAALNEPGAEPAWKALPSWFLYGSLDKNIPPAVHAFMAKRAGAKKVVAVTGASHVVMISHPDALVKLIDEATAETGN